MSFRTRPQKEKRRSRLWIVEAALISLLLIVFGRELWYLVLWMFNRFRPPDNHPAGLEFSDAYLTLLLVLGIMAVAFLLLLSYLAHRGAFPTRNPDEIAARIPRDDSYSLTNPHNRTIPYSMRDTQISGSPMPASLTFNPPYLRESRWDWIFPPRKKKGTDDEASQTASIDTDEFQRVYGETVFRNILQWMRDVRLGFSHQFRWFFGIRGYNAVLQKGTLISTETGKAYTHRKGLVISDFDGAYLLDASQEGQRTGIPPAVGWFGIQPVRLTKILEAAPLGRISKMEKNVLARTKDGIEILADISAVFSLGLRTPSVDVSIRDAEEITKRIYPVKLKKNKEDEYTFSEDSLHGLDEQDCYYIESRTDDLKRQYKNQPYQKGFSPFEEEFNPERIVRAMTSGPITSKGEDVDWKNILVNYTKDVFIREISNHNFNDLYGDPHAYTENKCPIDDILEEMQWNVMRDGTLTFRLFWAKNEPDGIAQIQNPSATDEPTTYTARNIGNAPTVPQQSEYAYRFFNNAEMLPDTPYLEGKPSSQKFLRARGIRVVAAEFENVRPKLPEIEDAHIDAWKAQIDKEILKVQGEIEREHIRLLNDVVADTQKQEIERLLTIFESDLPEDTALLEFLNALEEIVNRDDIKSIIPRDFHSIIAEVRQWVQHGGGQ